MRMKYTINGVFKSKEEDDWSHINGIPVMVNDFDYVHRILKLEGFKFFIFYINKEVVEDEEE